MRLLLINPNTNAATTETMRAIAARAAPAGTAVIGLTARHGAPLITDAAALAVAAGAVAELVPEIEAIAPHAVIVSAFGDPGFDALDAALACPVVGIGQAGFLEASAGGRRFAVATTTPDLVASITAMADGYGHGGSFLGVALTPGRPEALMADPEALLEALDRACREAIFGLGAEAVVIGGGPLGEAADRLAPRFAEPIVAPIRAAVRLAAARVAAARATLS
ncbi:hydantoin racemase [Prosthecomicrobium hirschii]|uniref:aspartate/glutamate racemase family protein n=1 Tax=Prosthecodimorpha hirschii TaxID=665126 RepID=UPI00112C7443|nr:aspartate/glutamate racemase family protein [Prosthecomicrobium hirschii]TPQ48213.1 hydantoin racemase [Prosthecomicrobium hirschii]